MKAVKKVLAFVICIIMLVTSMVNDGWFSIIESIEASAMAGHEQRYDDSRIELDFNKDWLFSFTNDDAAYMKGFDDSDWESVDLPHDFSMSQSFTAEGDTEAESGWLPGGEGWYRKWFNLYEYHTSEHVFLNFDGAYQHTYVYVNGQYVGENHYGYNSFSFELSDYLVCSNTSLNLIAVKVVNDQPNSRWYSGSGLNRNVTLAVAGPVHVALYGPRLTTPGLATNENDGTVEAKVKLHNDTAISKKVSVEATVVEYSLHDDHHDPVSDTVVYVDQTTGSEEIIVPAKTKKEITIKLKVKNPELWSLDDPNLYKLRIVVKNEAGELIDEYHTTFGFRYIEWEPAGGFKLNGEYIKLKGVCLHHDQGALGAAQEYEAIYRQLVTLKEMGCNAIRTSHNPASKIVIQICNQLGILVVEEFFDGWDASKNYNENDFSKFFKETISDDNKAIGAEGQKWYQYVVEHTILRDEHDPCVIAWDVGNELCNITAGESTENYETIVTSITNIVEKLDPSRAVLQGNNRPYTGEAANAPLTMIDSKMDVIGGNYSPAAWVYVMNDDSDPRSSKPFVATEAASAINSRGVYYTMGTDEVNFQCTSYDTKAVSWGNTATEAWYYAVTNDWFSGEFIWTGFDYIGEPTPWNDESNVSTVPVPNSSYFGVVDTAGFAKDSYYLYRSWWNEKSTTLHLVPGSWNSDSLNITNGYVPVAVYSNAKRIELLLNGEVIATATSTDNASNGSRYTYKTWTEYIVDHAKCSVGDFYTDPGADFYPQFSVKYEAGTLSVKAYDENNNEITDAVGSSKSVTGTATQVVTQVWGGRDSFVADGTDYIYVEFEARDADGNFMNDYNGTLHIKVDDSSARYAEIVGVDNGNPATTEKYQQASVLLSSSEAEIQMFNGKALAILRTTDEEGTINVTAIATDDSSSFSAQGVTVTSVSESGIKLSDELHEVIKQNGNKYAKTLYDEFEVVKYHINKLEKPDGSGSSGGSDDSGNTGGSGDSGDSTEAGKYEIFLPDSSVGEGCIPDGEYVINIKTFVMSDEEYDAWAILSDSFSKAVEATAGSAYTYQSFDTGDDNVFIFTHQGGNKYYIQNKSTGLYLWRNDYNLMYDTSPHLFTVQVSDNGSVLIYSNTEYSTYYIHCGGWGVGCFEFKNETSEYTTIWLYRETNNTPYKPYFAKQSTTEPVLKNGDYVISRGTPVMTGSIFQGWSMAVTESLSDIDWADEGSPYAYDSFNTTDSNVYTFTHQGGNKYYIQNKQTKQYLWRNEWFLLLDSAPHLFTVQANADGSVLIYNEELGFPLYIFREWEYFQFGGELSDFAYLWLYSKNATVEDKPSSGNANSNLVDLYDALYAGIAEDFSVYTRESFENLLRCLENGVQVFKDESSTNADYKTATAAIYAAIDALEMDIKKIDGTLFKYGYNNTGDAIDYTDGGSLMNAISIRNMKNAILADSNLVRQIKDIIGYDTRTWAPGYADAALDDVAEIYAKIYSLQFTGDPLAGYKEHTNNALSWGEDLHAIQNPLLTLWNIYTKENTRGEEDPTLDWGGVLHDVYNGASVQGLASATLEKGVVTSHAAYSQPLSYANDGHDYEDSSELTDIEYYFCNIDTGHSSEYVRLDYLSGISVYFPDLFTRENLDADGNVTTATTGQFAKYYWDAEFPIFITTDEYGVNTYHFNSKDTTHLVQASFDDEKQTVDMELNEVGYWGAVGPNSQSGFFPFNYRQGTTTYTGEKAIYHYGFTFEHNFYIPKGGKHANGEDVIFNFSGDDDVLVYIDGVLVLDNGGLHGAREVTINFTECTINYQFVMDVADGKLKAGEYEHTYSYSKIVENDPIVKEYNSDTIAALTKLHDVISDGQVHTLNFFYLERGSSDSNCRMSFNLSETSEEVRIVDQTLTLDYGLPVEYNINDNNDLSQAALDNNVKVEYLGLCAVNEEVGTTYTFELPEIILPFEDGVTYNVEGMKYGDCTIDKAGNTTYNLKSMDMAKAEHFYVCAKITGDPTYAEDIVYYQIERTTFVPATTIYYEDTFETITYTDGKVPAAYDNSVNEYGKWKTKGMQETTLKQNADLTDSEANPYGYDTSYLSFAEFSGNSVHYVDVSTKNNPNSKYSGGSGAAWPTVDFSFTGTGFDLISVTDNTTGAFSVVVKDADGKTVKSTVVDTFYGYNYGRIYMDANGKPTLDSSLTPMYRNNDGTCTSDERYYDENGAITDVAHYYDAYENVTENETDNPAYAYAYGWVVADDGTKDTLYQIPVIKITDLQYGSYSVTITPTFTSVFGHSSTASDSTNYYRVYLDAIKIYSPAGEGEYIKDKTVKDAYTIDDELYPCYLELKNMLVGADSLSEDDTQGIIFIDGIAALDNNIGTYKDAGPNNELYLAKDQAVAFEIWATAVPTDVQIGAKLACGKPALTVSYASKTTEVEIATATDVYYSFNTVLPNNGKLTWQLVEGSDGNNYYTTGTVVIQNTGAEGSVLSITNLKWTFSQFGGKGYFRIPTPIDDEVLTVSSTIDTPVAAYSLMRMRTAALDVEQVTDPEVATDSNGNSIVTIKLNTSADVDSLVITDENGNVIDPSLIEYVASELEDENIIEWTVNITTTGSGTYTYVVSGAYANGYTDSSKAVSVVVTIDNPSTEGQPDETPDSENGESDDDVSGGSFLSFITGIYNKLLDFFRVLFALFGITI